MQKDLDEIKHDVKEVKEVLIKHSVHLEQYNSLLDGHIKRTTLLEDRMRPVENHVQFVSVFLKFIGAISTAVAIALITKLLFK